MNYKRIIEELADRTVRHRKDFRTRIRAFCGRLLVSNRGKDIGTGYLFPDGRILDYDRLNNHQIKWW